MSLLQTSPQLIKVKQNSHFTSRGGVTGDLKKCKEGINVLCNWSIWMNAYTECKKTKIKKTHQTCPDTISDRTATSCLAARSGSIRSLECHPSTGPAKMRWRRSLLRYSLPGESPCVSTAKQLGAEDTEPFTVAILQYLETTTSQPSGRKAVQMWRMRPISTQTFSGSD